MRVAGLFSGIGGLERPFDEPEHETVLICDNWGPAQQVLAARFPSVPLVQDVTDVDDLHGADLLTAGFPCTDLSQAGRTAGIRGDASGLVDEVFRLLRTHPPTWLILENVRNILVLDGGAGMHYLTSRLERLGYQWAYRLVDSRFTGVPQRRHRVIVVASRSEDPVAVLFADDAGESPARQADDETACGFYWTEGNRGVGWAVDAIPPLKGGSGVGVPSPPGIWNPYAPMATRFTQPTLAAAEVLQGFPAGWTYIAGGGVSNGARWKLIGNAVTVGVGQWVADRIQHPGRPSLDGQALTSSRWPHAAAGGVRDGRPWRKQFAVSMWPVHELYESLRAVVEKYGATPLSHRAAKGFSDRLERSRLRVDEDFRRDLKEYVATTA